MRKILTIALREYRAMVATKAFLISIVMMPLLMLGGLFAMEYLQEAQSVTERKIAVFDPDGSYFAALEAAAVAMNAMNADVATETPESETPPSSDLADASQADASHVQAEAEHSSAQKANQRRNRRTQQMPGVAREQYQFERIQAPEFTDELGLELSRKIQAQEYYAFLVIPEEVDRVVQLDQLVEKGVNSGPKILFHSQDASLSDARIWISEVLNGVIRTRRFLNAKMDPLKIQELSIPVPIVGMGMVSKTADGSVAAKEENNPLTAIFLPMGVMMLMFMVIFMAAQPMLESVLEEKSQRIAEVLLGSASPFQLMTGKLLGTVAGSLTVFLIYLAGAWTMASYREWTDYVPLSLIPWFVLFQVLGVLFYAAIFLAVGASVSQLKEAQSLLLPVWMLMMSPMFIWIFIVRDPLGDIATWFSMFPPATPVTMMLRLATGQSIPIWQPLVGALILVVATFLTVVLAARIFRVGILWQGKTPKVIDILKWAFTG